MKRHVRKPAALRRLSNDALTRHALGRLAARPGPQETARLTAEVRSRLVPASRPQPTEGRV